MKHGVRFGRDLSLKSSRMPSRACPALSGAEVNLSRIIDSRFCLDVKPIHEIFNCQVVNTIHDLCSDDEPVHEVQECTSDTRPCRIDILGQKIFNLINNSNLIHEIENWRFLTNMRVESTYNFGEENYL
jgi:hypothetical protein